MRNVGLDWENDDNFAFYSLFKFSECLLLMPKWIDAENSRKKFHFLMKFNRTEREYTYVCMNELSKFYKW